MFRKFSNLIVRLIIVLLILQLQACDWVDSTGRQGNSDPVLTLKDGDIFADAEEESLVINAASGAVDEDGTIQSYEWSASQDEGALQVCTQKIDLDLAANSLIDVCEDEDNCEILFLEDEQSPGHFTVLLPKIRAPIGITHTLSVVDNDGGKTDLSVHFCIDSQNDSPTAADDRYSVSEGAELRIEGNGANGLLKNDSDDNDVRNEELTVVGLVEGKSPRFAESFSLGADGSFSYTLSTFTSITQSQDSFSYEVSDGENISNAKVLIDLSTRNDPPIIEATVPAQFATIGEVFSPLNIGSRIVDPEGSELNFVSANLPNGLSISDAGVISGVPTLGNPLGLYNIVVTASDEVNEVSLNFDLTLTDGSTLELSSPLTDKNVAVGVTLFYDINTHISNSSGSALTYNDNGSLPDRFVMNSSGVITGAPVESDIGSHQVTVVITDGIRTISSSFTLNVLENRAPIQSEPIPDQLIFAGDLYSFDVSQFFVDPENESITFSAAGLPASGALVISDAGLINGIASSTDATGLAGTIVTVTATDSSGHSNSGSFTLRIF